MDNEYFSSYQAYIEPTTSTNEYPEYEPYMIGDDADTGNQGTSSYSMEEYEPIEAEYVPRSTVKVVKEKEGGDVEKVGKGCFGIEGCF